MIIRAMFCAINRRQLQPLKGKVLRVLLTSFIRSYQFILFYATLTILIVFANHSAPTEKASKVSSTMKSIIIGRPSTTTAEPEEDEEDEVGFDLYKEIKENIRDCCFLCVKKTKSMVLTDIKLIFRRSMMKMKNQLKMMESNR